MATLSLSNESDNLPSLYAYASKEAMRLRQPLHQYTKLQTSKVSHDPAKVPDVNHAVRRAHSQYRDIAATTESLETRTGENGLLGRAHLAQFHELSLHNVEKQQLDRALRVARRHETVAPIIALSVWSDHKGLKPENAMVLERVLLLKAADSLYATQWKTQNRYSSVQDR